jgi:hypothetical protein
MKRNYLDFRVFRCRDKHGKFASCNASEEYFRKMELELGKAMDL